ncbi:MAG: hypothetical protein IKT00_03050 [Prevotella sp.]|nr:hypothetical protein [Prevotella sp.]
MKREYIQPESKYLTVNGQVVMLGTDDEEGYGSAMGNEAAFEEQAESEAQESLPQSTSVWE